jgi:hypothetical protein
MKFFCLLPIRNAGDSLIHFVNCICPLLDGIIVLDDCSDDLVSLRALYNSATLSNPKIIEIISKRTWFRDEPGDRNLLLERARYYGATHLLVLDSDEMLTANLLASPRQFLAIVAQLSPGDRLYLRWIQLWKSTVLQRSDVGRWNNHYKPFVFADHPSGHYSSDFIHTERSPLNLPGRSLKLDSRAGGVFHFQFCDWTAVSIKHIWYQMLEILRNPIKPISEIRAIYEASLDETGLEVSPIPTDWLSYSIENLPNLMKQSEDWRRLQIRRWIADHGSARFKGINTFGLNLSAV